MRQRNNYTIDGDIVSIELTQNKVATINKNDLPLVMKYHWCAIKCRKTYYAASTIQLSDGSRRNLRMHRLILGMQFGDLLQCDHIDGNGLNNCCKNIRIVTSKENSHNQHGKRSYLTKNPTSEYPGVWLNKTTGRWRAKIANDGIKIHLGYWDNELDAAQVYLKAKAIRDAGGSNDEIQMEALLAGVPKYDFYISGRMRGVPEFNKPMFNLVACLLRSKGYTAWNPAEKSEYLYSTFQECMIVDLNAVINQCNKMVLLPGWRKSVGANIEMFTAFACGKEAVEIILNEDETDIALISVDLSCYHLPYRNGMSCQFDPHEEK